MHLEWLNEQIDRYLIPASIVALAFITLCSFYNLSLQLNNLIKVEGKVQSIKIEEEIRSKGSTTHNLFVYLKTGDRFKVMDDELFDQYRQTIVSKVNSGDQVTIYRRTSLQTIFGLGTSNLIYQMEHNGKVLMPLSVMKTNFRGISIFSFLALLILIPIQMGRRKKRAKAEKKKFKRRKKPIDKNI